MKIITFVAFALLLSFCSQESKPKNSQLQWKKKNPPIPKPEAYAMDSKPVLIKGARIMTANGQTLERGHLLMEKGLIKEISENEISVSENVEVIDGKGLTLTPGLIDIHSHMGVYPIPSVDAHNDGNEMVRPVTSDVWAEHGFWPQDPSLWRAMAGGITTIQVLPGSGNLIGGRSFTAKLIPKLSAREMRFPDAPQGLKMACGENPKRVYKDKSLMTRMGNVAMYRKVYQEALEYGREWESYEKNGEGKIPKRDFVKETLYKVLKGEILVHFHCYRADDISAILDVASEFGFKIRTVHHGLEAYKIAPRLAKENVATATWADWWGFKAEAYDGIPYNIALLQNAGAKPIVHSDSETDVRFLNVETGKALAAAKRLGLDFTEDQALQWVTKNPAWAMGLDHKIGSLQKGLMADVVVWDGHPFSVYSKAQMVFINGKRVFDRKDEKRIRSDFEVGYQDMAFHDGRDFNPPPLVQKMSWGEGPISKHPMLDGVFVIENVTAFINGAWVEKQNILVRDGQIASVSEKPIEGEYNRVDGKGKKVTPGLIDPVSQLGLFHISLDSSAQDVRNRTHTPTPDFKTIDSLNLKNIRIPIDRSEGVTTSIAALDGPIIGSQAVAFDLDGKTIANEEVAGFGSLGKRYFENSNRSAIWSTFRQLLEESSFYSRNKSSYWNGQSPDFLIHHNHLEAMGPVLKGRPWIVDVDRADDIKKALSIGKNLNLVLLEGTEAWTVKEDLKKSKVPVILKPSSQTPANFDKTQARFDQAAYLTQEGIPVMFYGSYQGNTRLRQEAGFAVKYGMKPEDALKAITETPAQVFNLKRGQIKPGLPAHLVLWTGDPLEPTSWVERIWINGEEQSLENRQWKLAQKYLEAQQAK